MFGEVLIKHCLSTCSIFVVCIGYFTNDVLGEICEYQKSVYNIYTNSYDKTEGFTEECQWGCCYHHNSPCCSVPMKLIIGCILGGLGGFAILILTIFCIMYCRRKAEASARLERRRNAAPPPGRDAIYFSNSSSSAAIVSDPMSEPPPSYDEVMRGMQSEGLQNQGFKDDDPA